MAQRLVLGVFAAGVIAGCVGDASHEVQYRNATDVPLNVYADSNTPTNPHLLAPAEIYKDRWVVPAVWSGVRSGAPRQVIAKTAGGELVFCHRFTFDELERISWMLQIERRNDCSG